MSPYSTCESDGSLVVQVIVAEVWVMAELVTAVMIGGVLSMVTVIGGDVAELAGEALSLAVAVSV